MKIALLVSDLRRSRQFYAGLGFRIVERHEDGVTVALGDDVLELRSDAAAATGLHYFTPEIDYFPRGTGIELTLETTDIDALFDLARSTDADVVTALAPGDGPGRLFRLSDPDGYFVQFRSVEPGTALGGRRTGRAVRAVSGS
jgi:catechol 2,3-dioxygenase-like lactoylglutathione lyase family enzyme